MATTVSLRQLTKHLGDARAHVDRAMQSDESEPEMDFTAVRNALRSALQMLGEGTAGAADSAGKCKKRRQRVSLADVFPESSE